VNPNVPDVEFSLASLYTESGRLPEALRRAAQLDPKLADRENISQLIKDLGS